MIGDAVGKYDYQIDIQDLLPGDILLHRPNNPKLHQNKISVKTGSPYTHASIYLGDGKIAESTPPKVRIAQLSKAIKNSVCIGVLRSQLVFSGDRVEKLSDFIRALIKQKSTYDFNGVLRFDKKNKEFFENQILHIQKNFGIVQSEEDFLKRAYFCSALVVACYSVVGVIAGSGQAAYPSDRLSPADLHRDPTFGWFFGYLVPDGGRVPSDDTLQSMTAWRDNMSCRWW